MTTQTGSCLKKNKTNIICLIPARKGSKRIKNKNIKSFYGKPIISYSINIAKRAKIFDKIYISTDCIKTAKIAKKYGAETPFLRPKAISGDNIPDTKVREHFISYCKSKKIEFNYICYLYPCVPLLNPKYLKKSFDIIKNKKYEKLFSITKYNSNIERAFKKNKRNEIIYRDKKFELKRSQDLKDYYFDAGQFYWFKYGKKIIKKTFGFELNFLETIDINTYEDFKLAEKLFKIIK